MAALDTIIKDYFHSGFTYPEMQVLLELDSGVKLSLRHLKRHLKTLGLRRRRSWNDEFIQEAIRSEIMDTGSSLGCRAMARRLLTKRGINISRDEVLRHQHVIDAEGVQRRSRHCLLRRQYRNKGPNFLIHVDGYDKLKKYGFAIHGAICGFSRRILWLKVGRTNNDPTVIAGYFLQYVQEIQGVPRCMRTDAGTENVDIIDMQKSLRWYHGDSCSKEKSVIVGSSHANQRIEAWWRQLRRLSINSWMETFSRLEDEGVFSTASNDDIECLRFSFMKVLQTELDLVKHEWNEHRVRFQGGEQPTGKPDLLYQHPELYGSMDYKLPVDMCDVTALQEFCTYHDAFGCTDDAREVFTNIMNERRLEFPDTHREAINFFKELKTT